MSAGPLTEGSSTERDTMEDLYPVVEVEIEEEEEEEEEEQEQELEMMGDEVSAVASVAATAEDVEVVHSGLHVEDADEQSTKDVSAADLRSVDLQSAYEPELQLISSTEGVHRRTTHDAEPLTSQTKLVDALPASSQVLHILVYIIIYIVPQKLSTFS